MKQEIRNLRMENEALELSLRRSSRAYHSLRYILYLELHQFYKQQQLALEEFEDDYVIEESQVPDDDFILDKLIDTKDKKNGVEFQ